jgi:hypothetical protein
MDMDVIMTDQDVATQGSILSSHPALLAAQSHMEAYRKTFIAAKRIQA